MRDSIEASRIDRERQQRLAADRKARKKWLAPASDDGLADFIVGSDEEEEEEEDSPPKKKRRRDSGQVGTASSESSGVDDSDSSDAAPVMGHFGLMLQQDLRDEKDSTTPGLGFMRELHARGLLRVPSGIQADDYVSASSPSRGTGTAGDLLEVGAFLDMGRRLPAFTRFSLYLRMLALHLCYRHAARYLRARPRSEDSRGWVLARDSVEAVLNRHAENVRSGAWQQKGTAAAAAQGLSASFARANAEAGQHESAITASAVAVQHLPGIAIASLPTELRPARCGLCNRRMPARLALTMFSLGSAAWHPMQLRDESDFRASTWSSRGRHVKGEGKAGRRASKDQVRAWEWMAVPPGWESSIPRQGDKGVAGAGLHDPLSAAVGAFRTRRHAPGVRLRRGGWMNPYDYVQVPGCAWYQGQSTTWAASASP